MSDRGIDNPCAPQEPVEEVSVVKKTEPGRLFRYTRIVLLFLAIPAFLCCLVSLLILPSGFLIVYQFASVLLFIVSYIGLFFRGKWPYLFCFALTCTWIMESLWIIIEITPLLEEDAPLCLFVMVTIDFYKLFAVCSAVVLLLSVICALTIRKGQSQKVLIENVKS